MPGSRSQHGDTGASRDVRPCEAPTLAPQDADGAGCGGGRIRERRPFAGRVLQGARNLRALFLSVAREVRQGVSESRGKRSGRRLAIERDSELSSYVTGRMVRQPRVRASHLQREMAARFGVDRTPSANAIRNYMRKLRSSSGAALAKMSNPREFKNRWKPAFGSHRDMVTRANEVWEIDSTPSDVLTEGGRANLVGILDIATRRLCVHISATSDSNAVAACIRKAIMKFGAPDCIVSDNGKDYVSGHIRGAMARLGIRHETAPFRAPEMKPCIERAFGTLTRDLFERMDNYTGHDVAEHKDIIEMKRESERRTVNGRILRLHEKRLTLVELGEVVDRWIRNGYEHRPHAGLGGQTPTEKTQQLIAGVRMIPERALDILLMKSARRVVGREGVRIGGLIYIHEELGRHINANIEVRTSDEELGAVFCFEENGRFICRAENAGAMGVQRQEVARRARERQRAQNETAITQFSQMAGSLSTEDILRDIQENREGAEMPPNPVTILTQPIVEAMKADSAEETAEVPLSEAELAAAAAFEGE